MSGNFLIDPVDFYVLTATTFGIRSNTNNWEFYTQKYWKSGVWNPTYFLRTVDRHY